MNHYETLGLAPTAEHQVIEAAYKAMMKRYHPDCFDGSREEAERRSKELNEAYQVLKDPERRAAYDRTLGLEEARGRMPPPPAREPSSEPWDWDGDPMGIRGRAEVTPRRWGLMIAGGLAALLIGSVVVKDMGRSQAKVPPPKPATSPPASETTRSPIAVASSPAPAENSEADCRGPRCRVVTPFGWAGIESGVVVDSAERASGMKLRDDGSYDGSCRTFDVAGGPSNVWMIVEDGIVSSIEVSHDPKGVNFRTDRGVALGDPEKAVRAAYKELKQLPNIYSQPPDKMLFHYEPGGERGIKFSIVDGKVAAITVGNRAIEYVEACS